VPNIVDHPNSAPVWWSAPLGLSLVWLRSLGHRRDDTNYRPDSVLVGPNLRALSVVRPSAGSIAMGLGGYMGAKSDAEHYFSERAREAAEVRDKAEIEAGEVAEVFESYADNRREHTHCGCTSARRSDVDRFRAIRSGDYVRVEGRFLARTI
jgi:hypothetical protein